MYDYYIYKALLIQYTQKSIYTIMASKLDFNNEKVPFFIKW